MTHRYDLANITSVSEISEKIWKAVHDFKEETPIRDCDFIFFLLTLKRYNLLQDVADLNEDTLESFLNDCCDKLLKVDDSQYIIVYTFYKTKLLQSYPHFVIEMIIVIASISPSIVQKYFSQIFEELLASYYKSQERFGPEFMLPDSIIKVVNHIISLQKADYVYNPFAGIASLGIHLNEGSHYMGQEFNERTYNIGFLRLCAHNRSNRVSYYYEDPIRNWYSNIVGDDEFNFVQGKNFKFDLILCNPPYNLRIENSISGSFGNIRSVEHFLIENGINSLKEDGRLIAIIPDSLLYRSGSEANLRQFLIEQDLVEMIISLPDRAVVRSNIQTSILVLNKKKSAKGGVKLINGKKLFRPSTTREVVIDSDSIIELIDVKTEAENSRFESVQTIRRNNFQLTVARYFNPNYSGVQFSSFTTLITSQRVNKVSGKFVKITDLKDDSLEFDLDVNLLPDLSIDRPAQKITQSCFLVASRWNTLKPTYFKYEGTPIYISLDIYAFDIDSSKCNIKYLINELRAQYITDQVSAYRTGAVVPFISKSDLGQVQVDLPVLKEQEERNKKRVASLFAEKKHDLELFNKIHGLETEIFEQNAYLRHSLAGTVSNLNNAISNLKKLLHEKIQVEMPGILNIKLSPEHMYNLGEYLQFIERDTLKIQNSITGNVSIETEIRDKVLKPVDIHKFIEVYSNRHSDNSELRYKLNYLSRESSLLNEDGNHLKVIINANEELLTDLFDNLVENAIKHAFYEGNDNRIEISMRYNSEPLDPYVFIAVSNTGKTLPDEFTFWDFIRKGYTAGENPGQGFGGWYINEIIKKFNGEIYMIDESGPEGLTDTDLATSFEITFPILEIETNEEV